MLHGALLFLLLLASSTAAEQAQYDKPVIPQSAPHARPRTPCPWLTQGSAARLLGGDVSIKVSVSDTGEGSCRFVQEGSHNTLEILVSNAALTSCPTGSTGLQGIGNQAAKCNAPGSHSGSGYMVSGHVRDLHFTVTQTARGQKRPVKLSAVQQDALEQVAEQIAGNLY
jgi:hypothetical protein